MPYKTLLSRIMPDLDNYMTTQQAAEYLGFHLETIRRLLRDNELKGKKWRREWLVLRESVEDYKTQLSGKNKYIPHSVN